MGEGRFVVLEGVDGVGKTTQVALVSSWLRAIGVPHVVVREPGGTRLGEAVRKLVLSGDDVEISAESELLLILAARAELVRQTVRPALAAGTSVIADRFALSTLAYQVHGRGLEEEGVRAALNVATGGLQPDLCLVLDLPPQEAAVRRERAGARPDRIEQEGEAFRRTVRDAYLALAQSEPGVEVLSARGTPDEVHARIRAVLEARFPRSFLRLPSDVGALNDTER